MTREAFQFVMEENGVNQISSSFYVQFHSASKADRARTEIKEQYQLSDGQIGENTAVMGLSGASSNESMMGIYGIAVVLFVLWNAAVHRCEQKADYADCPSGGIKLV